MTSHLDTTHFYTFGVVIPSPSSSNGDDAQARTLESNPMVARRSDPHAIARALVEFGVYDLHALAAVLEYRDGALAADLIGALAAADAAPRAFLVLLDHQRFATRGPPLGRKAQGRRGAKADADL
mmetsp:Transcript_2873/g.10174  ORF Transcript_2873/g.10174 Transcript_2873/m.10174 type:complete len:125 (+) Transcript_2873:224-598(+)